MAENAEWAWMHTDPDGSANGPFDTCEEALADAAGEEAVEVLVGQVQYVAPTDWVTNLDATEVLERMEEFFHDNHHGGDREVFALRDEKEAQAELGELLKAWAAKHVVAQMRWWLSEADCEKEVLREAFLVCRDCGAREKVKASRVGTVQHCDFCGDGVAEVSTAEVPRG